MSHPQSAFNVSFFLLPVVICGMTVMGTPSPFLELPESPPGEILAAREDAAYGVQFILADVEYDGGLLAAPSTEDTVRLLAKFFQACGDSLRKRVFYWRRAKVEIRNGKLIYPNASHLLRKPGHNVLLVSHLGPLGLANAGAVFVSEIPLRVLSLAGADASTCMDEDNHDERGDGDPNSFLNWIMRPLRDPSFRYLVNLVLDLGPWRYLAGVGIVVAVAMLINGKSDLLTIL